LSLLRGDAANGWDHGAIDGVGVIEKGSKDFLNALGVFQVDRR
jgi:hypothetical protein